MKNITCISQEGLKIIACLTMLIDHIGYVFFPKMMFFRLIGRMSFPLFCFLLVEGVNHTKNPKQYGLRLAICAALAEIPFDLCFYRKLTFDHQNVIFTLLTGFVALELIKRTNNQFFKIFTVLGAMFLALKLNMNYGLKGILLIVLLYSLREESWQQAIAVVVFAMIFPFSRVTILGQGINGGWFALLALIPIFMYSGRKSTHNKKGQWMFYLFYPLHILLLYLVYVLMK